MLFTTFFFVWKFVHAFKFYSSHTQLLGFALSNLHFTMMHYMLLLTIKYQSICAFGTMYICSKVIRLDFYQF